MKDFEKLIGSPYRACVILDIHIGHLESHITTIKKHGFDVYLQSRKASNSSEQTEAEAD